MEFFYFIMLSDSQNNKKETININIELKILNIDSPNIKNNMKNLDRKNKEKIFFF